MAVNLITDLRWTTIRDEIRDELLAVDSVILVQPYVRFDGTRNRNEQRFKKKFIPDDGTGIINAWSIRRIEETREWDTNREIMVNILVGLNFWYSLDDDEGTQDVFDDVVDDVMTALQEPIRLDSEVELQGPAQLVTSDHRFLAGELVHHAEIQTLTEHRIFQSTFR